jgi:heme exporter protein A
MEEGSALQVTGRNGAGKSSLLAILSGFLTAHSGTIETEGLDDKTLPESLHFIGHRDGLKSTLTAGENLKFVQSLLGSAFLSPLEALDRVGLAGMHNNPVAYLSAGQRRRVALARLLVSNRSLWLLDEPTSALDHSSQRMLTDMMEEHLQQGGLIIAATHQNLGLENARTLLLERPLQEDISEELNEESWL